MRALPLVGAVLVHVDLDGDRIDRASLAAVAAGRAVASSWGATLYAALIANDPQLASGVQTELARAGADKIIVATTTAPIVPLWAAVGTAWQAVLDQLRPRLVLFGADSLSGAELGPRTAARLGARLLLRARAVGVDEVELRDRDGGYARAGDSGAAVVLVGGLHTSSPGDAAVDVVVIATTAGLDERVELAGTSAVTAAHTVGVVIALDDDAANDPEVAKEAARLATLLDAQLVGGVRQRAVPQRLERDAPLAPALCIAVGLPAIDLAGATSLVRIGSTGGKHLDGALPAPIATSLAELRRALGEP